MNRYSIHGTYAYRTDRGKVRKDDEDRSLVLMNAAGEVLLVVADGMGGANKGDVASKMAIDVIAALFRSKKPHVFAHGDKKWLKKAYRKANKAIYAYQDAHPEAKGMGTTLVAALLSGKRLLVANVGEHLVEHGQFAAVGGGDLQAGLRHERKETRSLHRDRLSSGIWPCYDEHTVSVPELYIHLRKSDSEHEVCSTPVFRE